MKSPLLISVFLAFSTHVFGSSMEAEVEQSRKDALAEMDVYECLMAGKVVAAVGMFATPACISVYTDGGMECKDSNECQGLCYSPDVMEAGKETIGICQGSELESQGCFSEIKLGVAQQGVCYD